MRCAAFRKVILRVALCVIFCLVLVYADNDAYALPPVPNLPNINIPGGVDININVPAPVAGSTIGGGPFAVVSTGLQNYCPDNGTLFSRIITCLEYTIYDAGLYFIDRFYPLFETTVTVVLVLAALLFGVMMAVGAVERLARDASIFILKLGVVLFFVDNVQSTGPALSFGAQVGGLNLSLSTGREVGLYERFYFMLGDMLEAISSQGLYTQTPLHCPAAAQNDAFLNAATYTVQSISNGAVDVGGFGSSMWKRADCIFDMIIGLSTSAVLSTTPNAGGEYEGLARGMMGFFYYNLQSGALGVLIGIIGLYICFNLLMALLKASYTYIIALLIITFLFIIGIMFMPLIMFKNTFEYFAKWVKMILSMLLQPLILFAYLNVLFVAFDLMLYSGEHSLLNAIVVEGPVVTQAPGFNLHDYMEANDKYATNSKGVGLTLDKKDLPAQSPVSENEGVLGNIKYIEQAANYAGEGLTDLPIHLEYRIIDYQDEAKFPEGAAGILGATLLVGLCSYILLTFLDFIPQLAQDLAGGVHAAPNVIAGHSAGVQLPFAQAARQYSGSAVSGFTSQLSKTVGGR